MFLSWIKVREESQPGSVFVEAVTSGDYHKVHATGLGFALKGFKLVLRTPDQSLPCLKAPTVPAMGHSLRVKSQREKPLYN